MEKAICRIIQIIFLEKTQKMLAGPHKNTVLATKLSAGPQKYAVLAAKYIGKIIKRFDLPFFIALLQNLIVATLSFILVIIFEEFDFSKIKLETLEILYAGILSGGFAFALQLFGQRNISAAPAAIVMSLEGVIAAIAAWIILNQFWN